MAKKSKRTRKTAAFRPIPPTADSTPSAATPTAVVSARLLSNAPAKVDLAKEYAYVLTDLRRIALIALAMFILLFALAIFLK